MKRSLRQRISVQAKRPPALFFGVCAGWLIVDQAVKALQLSLMTVGDTIPLIRDVFHLTYVQNQGAAFSILGGKIGLFVAAAVLFLVGVAAYWKLEQPRACVPIIGVGLVSAGAIGNAIDRILYGHVIDIFDARIIDFAVFNVADTGITVGIVLLLLWYVLLAGEGADE